MTRIKLHQCFLTIGMVYLPVMKKLIFIVLFLFIPAISSADLIYLKNGKLIEGQIFKETEFSVRINVNGAPYVYYREEIDHIDRINSVEMIEKEMKERMTGEKAKEIERERGLIVRLLEVNGARESMIRVFSQIIDQAPEEARNDLRKMLKVDKVIEMVVPTYAGHYDETELKELIGFYTSPTGKKHLELTPKIMAESLDAANKYFKGLVDDVDKKQQAKQKKSPPPVEPPVK